MVIFYFGGYTLYPWLTPETVSKWFADFSPTKASLLTALVLHVVLMAKVVFFLWIFIWVRWTLPRFRYDQLMDLGWRTMLPWALFNTVATAVVVLVMRQKWGG
jgi:NADH-quinone oxidoreductase subunit H